MQVNNNNQTSFGMKNIITYGLSRRMEKLVTKVKPQALRVGHVATDCVISPANGFRKVLVQVNLGKGGADCLIGNAVGRVFSKNGLLKLIQRANNELNQIFIDFRLSANPSKKDLNFQVFDCVVIKGDKSSALQEIAKKRSDQTEKAMLTGKSVESTKMLN